MAEGPLTRGLLGGADILQRSQAQDIQRQKLAQQKQQAGQKQKQQELTNANDSIDFFIKTKNSEGLQSSLDVINAQLGSNLNADKVLENPAEFANDKKAFLELVEAQGKNPAMLPTIQSGYQAILGKYGGTLGVEKEEIAALGAAVPEAPAELKTITSEKLIDDPESPTGFSVALLDEQGGLVKKLRNATDKDVKGKSLVTVNTGDLQKGTITKIESDILASDRTIGQLNRAEATFKPEFLTVGGKIKGGLQRLSEKAGFETNTEFLAEKARWFNQAKQAFFVYRKWVTGVAGGEKEMSDIAKAFPDPEKNSPTEYLANLKETRLWQRAVKKWLIETEKLGLSILETREILPEVGVGGEFGAEGLSPEDEAAAFLEG